MVDDNEIAYQVPDDQLSPEELEQRRQWQEREQIENSYDNSFKKNFASGIGEVKLRPVTEKTDFFNLKVDKIDWNFWMKGKPYEVVRVPGYPHRYDNCYYCYPQTEEDVPYNQKLIPFDWDWRHSLGNLKMEIYPLPSYRIKWDEYRTSFNFIGKLYFDTGILLSRTYGKNWGECFAGLQVSANKLESHPISFLHRNWREDVIGRKIWYNNSPAIITRINDFGEDSVLSFHISPEKEKLDCPAHWDEKENGICTKESWEEEYASGLVAEWDCPSINWFRD